MPIHERQVCPAKPFRESQLNIELNQSMNSMYQVIQIFSSDWIKGQSLSDFDELHAHTGQMSNVGQRILDFYIAAAKQCLTCLDRATSKSGGGGTVGYGWGGIWHFM